MFPDDKKNIPDQMGQIWNPEGSGSLLSQTFSNLQQDSRNEYMANRHPTPARVVWFALMWQVASWYVSPAILLGVGGEDYAWIGITLALTIGIIVSVLLMVVGVMFFPIMTFFNRLESVRWPLFLCCGCVFMCTVLDHCEKVYEAENLQSWVNFFTNYGWFFGFILVLTAFFNFFFRRGLPAQQEITQQQTEARERMFGSRTDGL